MNAIHSIAYSIAPATTERIDREVMSMNYYNSLISSGAIQDIAQNLANQVKCYTGPILQGTPKMFAVTTEAIDPMIKGTLAERLLIRRLHRHVERYLEGGSELRRGDVSIWDILRPSIGWYDYESPHKSDVGIGVWYRPRKR